MLLPVFSSTIMQLKLMRDCSIKLLLFLFLLLLFVCLLQYDCGRGRNGKDVGMVVVYY